MQDVGSDQVANMVMGDCWRKFPEGSHGQQESSGLFQFGPTSWSDCILSYMPGVESERAAQGIAGACGRKFPSRNLLEASDALESAAKERVKNCVMRYGKTTTSKVAALAIQGHAVSSRHRSPICQTPIDLPCALYVLSAIKRVTRVL